jgi:hypothetical protein
MLSASYRASGPSVEIFSTIFQLTSNVSSKLTSPTFRVSLIPSRHQKWTTLHNSTPSSRALYHPLLNYWSNYATVFLIKVYVHQPNSTLQLRHFCYFCLPFSELFVRLSIHDRGGEERSILQIPGICNIQTHALYTCNFSFPGKSFMLVFLNRRVLASIVPGRERFSWNLSF